MAQRKAERRRKRRSSPPSEEATSPSWSWSPEFVQKALVLSAGLLLFLMAATVDDNSVSIQVNEQQEQQRGVMQRRYLLNEEREQVFDIGVEENVWRRQLRARKTMEKAANDSPQMTMGDSDMMEDRPMKRMALITRYDDKHHFDDCVGKLHSECQGIIDTWVSTHPEDFNNQTTLFMDIRKIRELTDDSYYKVVIRTNLDGDQSFGIFDDGVIVYPWPWRVNGVDTTIGPWICQENNVFMTPEACCSKIQAEVAVADDNDNFLACFVEEPVGGPNNPEREDRAITVVDVTGKVVRAPIAH